MISSMNRARLSGGFTIIEVAIAMAIMSILIAIAIAAYSGVQDSSSDMSAEINLTRTFAAQRSYYVAGNRAYTTSTLDRTPEGITTVPSASTAINVVSVATAASDQVLGLTVLAENGDCWYLAANSDGDYVTGTLAPGTCTASRATPLVP